MRATAVSRASDTKRIFIVTSDEVTLPDLSEALLPEFEAAVFTDAEHSMAALREWPPAAVILDLDTVASTTNAGLNFLKELRRANDEMVLVALTRSHTRSLRIKAVEFGADESFIAPIDVAELRIVLQRAVEKRGLEMENRRIREQVVRKYSFGEIIGGSEGMQRVYETIGRVAHSSTTVMIRGESGTGKELVARAIVASSPRSNKPFISLNCAAIPETLIESELFGHEKGAFTGADAARPGHIELADTGTLFLDEISQLGLPLQAKLLRVLEEHAVQRIGGKSTRKIDFRLITATNDDLEEMVGAGRFREDLYYRIQVLPIHLPALRERTGDLPLLVDHFLGLYCAANNLPLKRMEHDALEILEEHSWPGNVRELENLIQRLVLMVEGDVIAAKHLPNQILFASTAKQESLLIPEGGIDLDEELTRIEAAFLQAALRRSGGVKVAAAALLHINPQKMKYLCRKHRL